MKKFFRVLRIQRIKVAEYARIKVQTRVIGVNQACNLFKISKNTFYNCQDKKDQFLKKYENTKKYIKRIIKKDSKYGIRRIQAELKQKYSINIGRDTLGKLLVIWGLHLRRSIKKHKQSLIKKILIALSDKTNILIRSNVTEPLQAVTSDITEIITQAGKFYLCVHKDKIGQMVYGWSLSRRMDKELVKRSLAMAEKNIKKLLTKQKQPNNSKIIWHQDQGSQYTSYQYINNVLKLGKISFSTPGTPTDNPGQESFFGRFKNECKDELLECLNFYQAQKFVKKKLKYYNNQRIHTSINYTTPKQFTMSFLKKGRSGSVN